jgi:hypothetical protein
MALSYRTEIEVTRLAGEREMSPGATWTRKVTEDIAQSAKMIVVPVGEKRYLSPQSP